MYLSCVYLIVNFFHSILSCDKENCLLLVYCKEWYYPRYSFRSIDANSSGNSSHFRPFSWSINCSEPHFFKVRMVGCSYHRRCFFMNNKYLLNGSNLPCLDSFLVFNTEINRNPYSRGFRQEKHKAQQLYVKYLTVLQIISWVHKKEIAWEAEPIAVYKS